MKAVNTEKLLQDFNDLEAKRNQRLGEIEQAATAFAISRGYDAERTAAFVKYVQDDEGGGLTATEKERHDTLAAYIYDAPEVEIATESAAAETIIEE